MERRDGPTFLSLTRQAVPVLDRKDLAGAQGLRRGGYVLAEGSGDSPDLILIASGSELHIALEARSALEEKGVATRVVSLPSWTLFAAQDPDYRQSVLPSDVAARVSVEAGTTVGWERWVGEGGASVGMDRFGASAPWQILYEEFGITAENAVRQAEALLRE